MHGLKANRSKLISQQPRRQQLYYIFHMILNIRRFSYNTCLALKYLLCCYDCRSRSSLKQNATQDYYLNKGIEKLNKDLDIVNLLTMIQGYRVLIQTMFG